jgi:DNA-binding NarL/FixJ family response regulator
VVIQENELPAQIDPLAQLTPLERTVLQQLLTGATNKEIAAQLRLSPFTVREYVQRIARKMCCRNRVAIAALCATFPSTSLQRKGSGAIPGTPE